MAPGAERVSAVSALRDLSRSLILACLFASAAFGVRWALLPYLHHAPFLPFTLAVMAAARFGGLLSGFLATALGTLITWYFFLEPLYSFTLIDPSSVVALVLFTVVGSGISLLAGQLRRSLKVTAESEQRYRLLSESVPQLVWTCLPDGACDYVNPRWVAYTGIPADRQLGGAWLEQIHPDDRQPAIAAWQEAVENDEPFDVEYRIRRNDGAYRWFKSRALALKNPSGRTIKWFGTCTDIEDLRRAEIAIRESQNSLAFALESSGAGHWELDLQNHTTHRSPLYDRIFGYPELLPEWTYEKFLEHVVPEEREMVNRMFTAAFETGGDCCFECRITRAGDGAIRWIWSCGQHRFDEHGNARRMAGVVYDITERKQAELAARQWQQAFEQAELGITMSHPDSRTFAAANRTFARQRGYKPSELQGRPISSVFPQSEIPKLNELIRIAEMNGHAVLESVHLRKDGSTLPVLIDLTGIRDDSGRLISRVAFVQDITERKRAEEELRRSRALYRDIAANIPDSAVCVVDHDLRYLAVEGCLVPAIGFSRDTMEGRTVNEVLSADVAPSVAGRFLSALDGHSQSHESESAGRVLWTRYVPIRDDAGHVLAAMALSLDITARKQAEDEIRTLNAELEQRVRARTSQLEAANRELEAFSYSVSHDLRAPLRGIDGWSLALLEDSAHLLDARALEYLRRVRSETQRMGNLIDDLLRLSRIARSPLESRRVNLSALARTIAGRLAEANPGRCITFHIQPDMTAAGDIRLLEIALTNLLGNAAKFTCGRTESTIEFARTTCDGDSAFFVRDNGAGFDMAYAQLLFGAFQRLHKASEFPGSGIGLATVQRIVHRHGGRIWAHAQPEQGATFYFTLGGTEQ